MTLRKCADSNPCLICLTNLIDEPRTFLIFGKQLVTNMPWASTRFRATSSWTSYLRFDSGDSRDGHASIFNTSYVTITGFVASLLHASIATLTFKL